MRRLQIGLIGSYEDLPIEQYRKIAQEIGQEIAKAGAILVGGVELQAGLVREAAKGCKAAGGFVLSVPRKIEDLAPEVDVFVPTYGAIGLREYLLPLACDAIISINGGSGTLNEISVAYQNRIPVVMLANSGGWTEKLQNQFLDARQKYRFETAKTPKEAVELASKLARARLENGNQ
jgi:hypothetical protein